VILGLVIVSVALGACVLGAVRFVQAFNAFMELEDDR
jgi:uncharacterized membrane protein YidH (DUF202 family)